jgi:hypothetical protein
MLEIEGLAAAQLRALQPLELPAEDVLAYRFILRPRPNPF